MPSRLKKVWNIITTALVAAIAALVLLLIGVRAVGIKPYAVLSGSMEPEYPVGSLLYVKRVDTSELKAGDDITFMLDEDTVATHRIIEVIPDEGGAGAVRFRTKGIANEYADGGSVHCKNVIGKPVFDIPYLGYASSFIKEPPGLYIAITGGVIILLLAFLPDLFKDNPKRAESIGEIPQN
ncbi:MAG: signal peptidase I [Acutalibacteraceae bacterium]